MASYFECMEQYAIELVSAIGKEHVVVANCSSDINADTHSVKIVTFEEAFEYGETGIALCLLMPKAFVFRKLVDRLVEKQVSVHFVFTYPTSVNET